VISLRDKNTLLIIILFLVSINSIIIFNELISHYAFGNEESFTILQTGIISTSYVDYQVSNNFDIRILHDGKLMRISGITTSGHPYYAYQKIIDDKKTLNGKILVDGQFIPIIQRDEPKEQTIEANEQKDVIVLIKQPHHGYYYDSYIITAKSFESKFNPNANFNQNWGYVEGVKINVTLTKRFGNILTSFGGETNQHGTYTGKYIWGYRDQTGEYNVTVVSDYRGTTNTQNFNTFYRGYISNFTG
jgi:hypothetical protein